MRETPIREFKSDIDLDAIRKVSGNDDLSESEVFDFGTFVIARSGVNRNQTDITSEGQKAAVKEWIGKPILYRDHDDRHVENQIGRIYDAWTEDRNQETITYGKGYGVRTDDLADVFKRIENGIHREMSCGYEPIHSVCSTCGSDLDTKTFSQCPKGHKVGTDGMYAKDISFEPAHLSFTGRPAVEGAGLLSQFSERIVSALGEDRNTSDDRTALQKITALAEDGIEFRQWASNEFTRWYQRNNPQTNKDDALALAEKLSAKEMIALARIEQRRFSEVIPDGSQQTVASVETSETEAVSRPQFKSVNDLFSRKGK